jgi:hypothetical protein
VAKTQGEKVDDLLGVVSTLTERIDSLRTEVRDGRAVVADIETRLRETEQVMAVTQQLVADAKKWQDGCGFQDLKVQFTHAEGRITVIEQRRDLFGNRAWAIGTVLLSVLLSGAITFGVNWYFQRNKEEAQTAVPGVTNAVRLKTERKALE